MHCGQQNVTELRPGGNVAAASGPLRPHPECAADVLSQRVLKAQCRREGGRKERGERKGEGEEKERARRRRGEERRGKKRKKGGKRAKGKEKGRERKGGKKGKGKGGKDTACPQGVTSVPMCRDAGPSGLHFSWDETAVSIPAGSCSMAVCWVMHDAIPCLHNAMTHPAKGVPEE